jgi:hypothetical protein
MSLSRWMRARSNAPSLLVSKQASYKRIDFIAISYVGDRRGANGGYKKDGRIKPEPE